MLSFPGVSALHLFLCFLFLLNKPCLLLPLPLPLHMPFPLPTHHPRIFLFFLGVLSSCPSLPFAISRSVVSKRRVDEYRSKRVGEMHRRDCRRDAQKRCAEETRRRDMREHRFCIPRAHPSTLPRTPGTGP